MSMFSEASYTIKVIIMKASKENVLPITQSNWNEFQSYPEIKTFTRRYPMDLKVYELKQSLCNSGFISNESSKSTMYIADGFGKPFTEVTLVEEKNKLEWASISDENLLLSNNKFTGNYNIPHIVKQIKQYLEYGTDISKY